MRREWEPEDLVAGWTLVEQDEVAYKRGPTSLGFALLLKYFEMEGRFPRHVGEQPPAAVGYVARQVGVDPVELAGYEWSGRTFEYHRAQIRRALGFRRFGEDDEARLGEPSRARRYDPEDPPDLLHRELRNGRIRHDTQ